MNTTPREKILVLGFLSHFPVAGVAWQTVHYLVGFQRLGYDVYYVEAHGCTPSKLMCSETDDGAARASDYIATVMHRFDFDGRWAYHALYPESRCFGMSESHLKALYRSAALIINLHGSHLPTPDLTATNRLVYLGTDPVDIEIDVFHGKQEALDYLAPHCAFFTFGENLGQPDCRVPVPTPFTFRPTRQPIVLDFWEEAGRGAAAVFTTIGNWRQPGRTVQFEGETYPWSKELEFHKFLDLPRRVPQLFELALSSCAQRDRRLLEDHGWRVRPAMPFSQDLDAYRRYIGESRGEFTVAKDQNVRLRSGWFSDRAATYLAAGRPVINQETGFSNILPTGEGLFTFSTIDDVMAAVEAINADYERHRRAARRIARECFGHDVVLARMLRDLGVTPPGAATPAARPLPPALPPSLVITPIGRWPTRLPEETLRTALSLPVPAVRPAGPAAGPRCSVVVLTRDALPYTKMCVTALLHNDWQDGDELIVVDNASGDGTPDYLRELAEANASVRTILNESNRGFAAGNNQGLALARGDVLVLLNNDALVTRDWRQGLLRPVDDPGVGLVGPVANRTCNEAQIDAPYRTCGELAVFADERRRAHRGEVRDIHMLAMFCTAMRREVFERVGPLDEQFEIGMFEDDDYSRRVRQAGYRVLCVEDTFVHHFGQATIGHLCADGEYDRVLEANRRRFEEKWGVPWKPHGRRITPEYEALRRQIRDVVARETPAGSTVIIVSKGDEELLRLDGRQGWHFPQADDGRYANVYPADSAEAVAQLDVLRGKGGRFLLIPKPAFWWLDHYADFREHLDTQCRVALRDENICVIYDLRGSNG